jgi:hypothetical protein
MTACSAGGTFTVMIILLSVFFPSLSPLPSICC